MSGFDNLIKTADECIPFYTSHLDKLRGFMEVQKEAKSFIANTSPEANLNIFSELENLNGVNALVTISLLDLLVVCKHLCIVKQPWERAYFIKNGYLIIHETLETYSQSQQPVLRGIISSKYPSFLPDFNDIFSTIKRFRKEHDFLKTIKGIRNTIAGHIDNDFCLYYDTTLELDGEAAGNTISVFLNILRQLQDFLTKLTVLANYKIKEESMQTEQSINDIQNKIEDLFSKFDKFKEENKNH